MDGNTFDGAEHLPDEESAELSQRDSRRATRVQMTELDWAILNELTHEPHMPARAIAENLGTTANQIVSRLRKLDRKNAFHVIAALDLRSMGQSYFFAFASVKGRPLQEVAQEISAIPEVAMVGSTIGNSSNLVIACRFKDNDDLSRIVYDTIALVRGVYDIKIAVVLQIPIFNSVYLDFPSPGILDDVDRLKQDIRSAYGDDVVDDTDISIIAELQQNGRSSINSIARKHEINAGTVRYRLRSLESRGIINFVTLLNPQVVSLGKIAILTMNIEAGATERVLASLESQRWLPQLFLCAGPTTVIGIMIADSLQALIDLQAQEIDAIDGVFDVRVTPMVSIYKNDVRWAQKPKQRSD